MPANCVSKKLLTLRDRLPMTPDFTTFSSAPRDVQLDFGRDWLQKVHEAGVRAPDWTAFSSWPKDMQLDMMHAWSRSVPAICVFKRLLTLRDRLPVTPDFTMFSSAPREMQLEYGRDWLQKVHGAGVRVPDWAAIAPWPKDM